jgi:hypothetical protein
MYDGHLTSIASNPQLIMIQSFPQNTVGNLKVNSSFRSCPVITVWHLQVAIATQHFSNFMIVW